MLRIGRIIAGLPRQPQGTCVSVPAYGPVLLRPQRPSSSQQGSSHVPAQSRIAKHVVRRIPCLRGSRIGQSSGKSRLNGEVNGKASTSIEFDGHVNAGGTTSLILQIQDFASRLIQSGAPSVSGIISYNVTYFKAPNGKHSRRTAKHAEFCTYLPIRTEAPLEPRGSIGRTEQINWLFSQEREE